MFQVSRRPATLLVVALIVGSNFVVAQDEARPVATPSVAGTTDAKPTLTLAEVEATLAAIEGDTEVAASVKEKYKQAIDALKQAAEFSTSTGQFLELIENGSGQVAELGDQLQALPSVESAGDITAPAGSTEELQRVVDARRAALKGLSDELSSTTTDLTRVKGRPVEISARLPELQRELSEVLKQIAAAETSPEPASSGAVAKRIWLQASQSSLLAEQEMLEQEQLCQSVREEFLTEKQKLLTRQVENATAANGTLQAVLNQRLTSEAQRIAEALPRDVPQDDVAAQKLAAEVQELADEFKEVVENTKKLAPLQQEVSTRLKGLTEQYDVVKRELLLGGGGQKMAQVLIELDGLTRLGKFSTTLPTTLDQSRLDSFHVNERIRKQAEVETEFANRSSSAIARLITSRKEVLDKLNLQYANLTRSLGELEGERRQFLDKSKEVRAYVRDQLFGFSIKSAPPLGTKTFTDLPAGISWAFRPAHWQELFERLWGAAMRWPIPSVAVVLAATTLLIMRRTIWAAIEETGSKTRRISTDRYSHTLQALGWTLLLAVPIPLLMGFAGWCLRQTYPGDWVRGISQGLWSATWVTFACTFLAAACRPPGLGPAHFGWTTPNRLRRAILQFLVVYVPAMLCTHSLFYGDAAPFFGSVGRLSFILAQVWIAIVLWRLFQGSDGVLAAIARNYPARVATRWRQLWFPLVLATPIALVIVACLGYLITATSLSLGLLMTVAIISVGEVLFCMTLRWFAIKQRRLALEEALERRRARQDAATIEEQTEQTSEVVSIDAEDDEQLDMESISEQTRSLLRLVFGLGVLTAIIVFWSGVIPLDDALARIPLPLTGLNMLAILQAILTVVVTYFAVRNLPGLLELAVLREKTIEPGPRNAISTLCQYALVAFGAAVLFKVLQLDWEKFGWMAAALSVGIGFGLQEVVANFVSGLILLLEQPIRVGDVVTLEGMTGTVTKIHLRATTITNWDRQDIVVPNKSLITGTILNWTLSASVNRIVIPVGVAYGADTEKARQILLDVAADHPAVLSDPAPIASVEQFADSSVNLMLRAYLPDLKERISATTELHTEIVKRFQAAGIEIPFPQQDLHLRNGLDKLSRAAGDTAAEVAL